MFYQVNLAVLATGSAYLLYKQWKVQPRELAPVPLLQHRDVQDPESLPSATAAASKFKYDFFVAYALAVAADWLQGPYIYAVYKYEKRLPERHVALLYATGFAAGALSAGVAGALADRHGRRAACLAYCFAYAAACLSVLWGGGGGGDLVVLLLGRVAGGVGTTLLCSAFEAWMVSEHRALGDGARALLPLADVFRAMTALSCAVAIVSGIAGDVLVSAMGGARTWPFVAGVGSCAAAACFMLRNWRENYGTAPASSSGSALGSVTGGLSVMVRDANMFTLGLTTYFFEGSMYLFIFFWSPALKSARDRASTGGDRAATELPFGLIFSSFMCCMMAGSALSGHATAGGRREGAAAVLAAAVVGVSACLSAAVVAAGREWLLFWVFCVVEACVGAYFPSMGLLKSEAVEDGVRGRVYSVMRFPLNAFVVVAHALDEEGGLSSSSGGGGGDKEMVLETLPLPLSLPTPSPHLAEARTDLGRNTDERSSVPQVTCTALESLPRARRS
ncbi:hypothetical protein RB597_009062 [Gaeumannomyces tritici]